MSSTQSRTLTTDYNNCKTYYTGSNVGIQVTQLGIQNQICLQYGQSTTSGYATFTSAAKDILYPNSTAHPISCLYDYYHCAVSANDAKTSFSFDGVNISSTASAESNLHVTGTSTAACVTNSTKNSVLRFDLSRKKDFLNLSYLGISAAQNIVITLYFTRYDYTSIAGTGIARAVPLSKSLVSGAVSGSTGGYSAYYNGQIAYTTLDGSKCVSITNDPSNAYPDGAIIDGITLTAGKQYFYKVEYNAPVGKDIRIGMRLTNGGNTENVVVTGTGTWQSVRHLFTATSDMSGQLEVVENGAVNSCTWYTRNVTIKDTVGQGYDGDQLGFYAEVQDGYQWDGWYSGDTKVSSNQYYLRTVDGSDVQLTARATATTRTLSVTYCGTSLINTQVTPPVNVTYGGTLIASVASGETKTLKTFKDNKPHLLASPLVIGGKTISDVNSSGKKWQFEHDIIVTVS